MSAYLALRNALARQEKHKRLDGKTEWGAPTDEDYRNADLRIDAMSHTTLMVSLERSNLQS